MSEYIKCPECNVSREVSIRDVRIKYTMGFVAVLEFRVEYLCKKCGMVEEKIIAHVVDLKK